MTRAPTVRHLARGASLALALLVTTTASAGELTGIVYTDLNGNGKRDAGSLTTAADTGIGGITVEAFPTGGAAARTTTTAPDGSFTIADVSGKVRVEFTGLPAGYHPAPHGPDNGTSVQFATVPAVGTRTLTYGVADPAMFCVDNPQLATSCFHFGAADGVNADTGALWSFPSNVPDNGGPASAQELVATTRAVGSVYGLGVDPSSGDLYSGAYMKRHAGFGPGGPGAIYRSSRASGAWQTSVFALVPGVTTDPHSSNGGDYNGDGYATTFEAVGKYGLGDVDVSPDGSALYTVALQTRRLHRIALGGSSGTADAGIVIPNPGCSNADDWRPFATGFDGGVLHVAGVCSAESTQKTSDLVAYVLRVDGTSFVPVLSFALNYDRKCGNDARNASIGDPGNARTCQPRRSALWQPWRLAAGDIAGDYDTLPQPMLTDITFERGAMVLGFRDRYGDQMGNGTHPVAGNTSSLVRAVAAGDILRACASPAGWQLESNATCGATTTAGASPNPAACATVTTTHGCEGPGGGEFYYGEEANPYHDETATGGIAQTPGFPDVMAAATEPEEEPNGLSRLNDGGVVWLSNSTGNHDRGYRVYDGSANNAFDVFAKANGVGDLEALCGSAPLEIGNRVWYDADRSGIQDPEESGIGGVVVRLVGSDGSEVARTTTDEAGDYYFPVSPNSTYVVAIRLGQDPIKKYVPTLVRAGGNGTIDSDGTVAGPDDQTVVKTGAPGQNDHTYDFGFSPESARLGISKKARQQRVRPGQVVDYTIVVRNYGPGPATNVVVCDRPSEQLAFRNLGGGRLRNGVLCWRVSITAGATKVLRLKARVSNDASGSVYNTAVIQRPGKPPITSRSRITVRKVTRNPLPPGVVG